MRVSLLVMHRLIGEHAADTKYSETAVCEKTAYSDFCDRGGPNSGVHHMERCEFSFEYSLLHGEGVSSDRISISLFCALLVILENPPLASLPKHTPLFLVSKKPCSCFFS